ncbi:MAG: putative permease [Firmicutes bacterium]|nr:putative permease [Bacillota bacterium]
MKKLDFRTVYAIAVFLALACFDFMILGLFPPLFHSISADLGVHISSLGFVLALNIFVTSVSAVVWGYLAGKYNRKMLIMIGTILWSVSVFLTSRAASYTQLVIYQTITGLGLGCISSIGYSMLSDYVPQRMRGTILSLWGISQGFGSIAGALLASIVSSSSNDWRVPFQIVSIVGLALILLYIFVKEPGKGASDPELHQVFEVGLEYEYTMEMDSIRKLFKKQSNIYLFLEAFFYNIATGTLIWLPTLYLSKIMEQGYSPGTATVASGYFYALFQIGGLTATLIGYYGDKLQKESLRARARFASIFMFLAMPAYIAMYFLPMKNLQLPDDANSISIMLGMLHQIIFNPWVGGIFLLSIIACQALSSNGANWIALITDVNLPEDRAAAYSLGNLANGMGRTIGNAAFSFVLAAVSAHVSSPLNYEWTLSIFQLFFIPAGFLYLWMSKHNKRDISRVKSTLRVRARRFVGGPKE